MSTNTLRASSRRHEVPDHLIVARDHAGLCQALCEVITAQGKFTIVVDRRKAERRQSAQPVRADRRRSERRSLSYIESDLRQRRYVMIRPPDRLPHS